MKRTLLFCLVPFALSTCALAASAADGYLKVNATPRSAGVYLDGAYLGPAARFGACMKYKLPAGKYEIRVTDPRYEDATASVTIEAGKTAHVDQPLKAKPAPTGPFGLLKIKAPNNTAAVLVNGEFVGHVDEFDNSVEGLLIPPGNYIVRIDLAGNNSVLEQVVTVAANQTTLVTQDTMTKSQ
ncbi:MAG TPA: PEGA domain-containing protein [Bryobacteraceae bacterium]|nr:PEGA domain-containing protein [Bryobacteraceae bacterium]